MAVVLEREVLVALIGAADDRAEIATPATVGALARGRVALELELASLVVPDDAE